MAPNMSIMVKNVNDGFAHLTEELVEEYSPRLVHGPVAVHQLQNTNRHANIQRANRQGEESIEIKWSSGVDGDDRGSSRLTTHVDNMSCFVISRARVGD